MHDTFAARNGGPSGPMGAVAEVVMAKRAGLVLGILALGVGCDFEPNCGPLQYNRSTDLCECPMSAPYDVESGGCVLPDGGVIPVDGGPMIGGDAGLPPATDACTPSAETCNGLDDDCDGDADEAAASAACEAVPGATRRACTAGACVVVECASGRDDCNGEYADGCEAELASDDAHCGGCGLACEAGRVCVERTCRASPVSDWIQVVDGSGRVDVMRARATRDGVVAWGWASGANSISGVELDDSVGAFVATLDESGDVTWVVQPRGPESTISQAVLTDEGAVFVCGEFESTLTLGTRELVANNVSNGFIARIERSGNIAWVTRVAATVPTTCGAAVLHDGAPHFALLPNARGDVSVGTTVAQLDSGGGAIIVRLEPEVGIAVVQSTIVSAGYLDVTAMESSSQALLVGGSIGGAARFSATLEVDSTGGYVAALDDGGVQWVSAFESGFYAPPRALVSMPDGSVVAGGYFYERVSIDGRGLDAAAGSSAAYVVQLEQPTGDSRWATSVAADLRGMVRLGDDDLALAAWYDGALTLSGETRSAEGTSDCALIAIRGRSPRWLASLGSSAGSRCDSLSTAGSALVLAGTHAGPIGAGVVDIPHSTGEDGFVWRFRAR